MSNFRQKTDNAPVCRIARTVAARDFVSFFG